MVPPESASAACRPWPVTRIRASRAAPTVERGMAKTKFCCAAGASTTALGLKDIEKIDLPGVLPVQQVGTATAGKCGPSRDLEGRLENDLILHDVSPHQKARLDV